MGKEPEIIETMKENNEKNVLKSEYNKILTFTREIGMGCRYDVIALDALINFATEISCTGMKA